MIFKQTLLKYQLQMTSQEQAMWTHNCCRDVENNLMFGKGPVKLFRDKSNTCKLEDWLKIDAGSIWPEKLFILKFLKNNLHFQYTIRSNDLTNIYKTCTCGFWLRVNWGEENVIPQEFWCSVS
jgi:hypothetical protein